MHHKAVLISSLVRIIMAVSMPKAVKYHIFVRNTLVDTTILTEFRALINIQNKCTPNAIINTCVKKPVGNDFILEDRNMNVTAINPIINGSSGKSVLNDDEKLYSIEKVIDANRIKYSNLKLITAVYATNKPNGINAK